MKGSTRLFLVAVIASVGATPGAARAWSTQGGETLQRSENAVHAGAGFPWALQTGYHMPLINNFELIPSFGFYYGQNTTVPVVGNTLTAGLKFRLLQTGKFHLALMGEPGFLMNYYPDIFLFGVVLGLPQVLCTYNFSNAFSLHFGLRMPISIVFGRKEISTFANIPVLAHVGMEYAVSSSVNIFAKMDMGVSIVAMSKGSDAEFYPSFVLGGAFRF